MEAQTDDAAQTIARIYAKDIVKELGKDQDDLKGKYIETIYYLRNLFKKQGVEWLKTLESSFESETLTEAWEVAELRTWQFPDIDRLITDQ